MINFKNRERNEDSLPYSFFAEQGILNIFLTHGTNINLIKNNIENLNKDSFYYEPHRLLFEIILDLWEKNISLSLTNILSKLEDSGNLKKIGGFPKITSIINQFENYADLENYVKLVNEKYIRRLIIELGKQSIRWGYSTSINVNEIIEKIENSLTKLSQEKVSEKTKSAAEVVEEIYIDLKTKKKNIYGSGFNTSFKDIDAIIQGFQKSDLIIIAGRPSVGKTAFSLNVGKKIVEKYEIPLLIFTLEMSRQQIIYRLIASEANMNGNRLKSGKMTLEELNNLKKTMKTISKLPIFIEDNPNLTIADIKTKIKKIFLDKNKNGLVIIDYLQLMKLNLKLENRVQEISYLTRNLKLLAKEFNVPIILLSQVSRIAESRLNKRPILSDLRESGCVGKSINNQFENFQVWNTTKIISQKKINFEFKGIKPTYKITFANNIELQLTANHKILSKKGWVRINELSKNSEICIVKGTKNLTNEKIFNFIQIQNIEYQGISPVFDKTIPFFHHYILNNIILHNSIEQDADIVIMLYRDESAIEKIPKKQVIEFIVAKHRNGPIGTATLLFNPITTTFLNFSNS